MEYYEINRAIDNKNDIRVVLSFKDKNNRSLYILMNLLDNTFEHRYYNMFDHLPNFSFKSKINRKMFLQIIDILKGNIDEN